MSDQQAERIATALETLIRQNERIIRRLGVIANAASQSHGGSQKHYYFSISDSNTEPVLDVSVPNATTIAAFEELENGGGEVVHGPTSEPTGK